MFFETVWARYGLPVLNLIPDLENIKIIMSIIFYF